jgi:hypothetical protein
MRHRTTDLARRLSTLLFCTALILGQGADLAHAFVARHVYCALHDAWEHVEAGDEPAPVAAASTTEREGARVVPDGSSEGHERCTFEACPHEPALVLGASLAPALGPAPAAHAAPSRGSPRLLPQVPLVLLAPSHSPPA